MRPPIIRPALGLALLATGLIAASNVRGETLNVGDKAPPVTVSKWVKGDPIESFKDDKVYVVEFWATWCGPCRVSIPHLTELQKKYKDKGVQVVGVSVWEDDQKGVGPFVEEMGDQMEYAVAMDRVPEGKQADEGAMAKGWMEASAESGIPTAFIVQKDGRIAWIGHPMSMDEPLKKIVAGDWDVEVAAKERREGKDREKKLEVVFEKFLAPYQAEEYDKALAIIEEALKDDAGLEKTPLGFLRFDLLIKTGKGDDASKLGERLVSEIYDEDMAALNNIAWMIVDPAKKANPSPKLLDVALKAAEKANELGNGENPGIIDTLALVVFKKGDKARALELQEKAVKAIEHEGGDVDEGMKDRLEQYRRAVADKDADGEK